MFLRKLFNYVYPNVCGICGKRIFSSSYTCTNCLSILKCYKERIIFNSNYPYDYMLNMYEYNGIVKSKICKFKFNDQKYIAKTFASLMMERIKKLNLAFDVIIPVPISINRYMERGYNQSYEIAKILGKILRKAVYKDILIKIKNNQRQSMLNINERKKNVLGVYKTLKTDKIKGKVVLLVDDIYTTGATVNECARVLKESGAKKVLVITIAYA